MSWRDVLPEAASAEIAAHPLVLALFGLEDCAACSRVKQALAGFDFSMFRTVPISVQYVEFNPAHAQAMEEQRLAIFPHVRLYAQGRLIGAWESLAQDASDADIRSFTLGWMARTLSARLSTDSRMGQTEC